MKNKPIYITRQGMVRLEARLHELRTITRPQMIEQLQDARSAGDMIDNTEYLLLENELGFLDGRIQQLEQMRRHARLIAPGNADNVVDIGETVVLQTNGGDLEHYTIVGVAETDPGVGLISNESPLGKALIGHKVGDDIQYTSPDGEHRYHIVAVT